jgi:REP element-mobilizing transposase RayT
MSQSLSQIYVHIIFHIQKNNTYIRPVEFKELYSYISGIIRNNQSQPINIGGTDNHIHILCTLSKNVTMAKLVEEIKRNSSRWIKSKGHYYKSFAWQKGYAVFSVSASVLEKTKQYIANQERHHREMSYQEEVLLFLKEYNVNYNEDYLWSD